MVEPATLMERALARGPASRNVRLPDPQGGSAIEVSALWTTDGCRPRWDNLQAAAITSADKDLDRWPGRLSAWRVQLGIIAAREAFQVLEPGADTRAPVPPLLSAEAAQVALQRARDRLFAPEILSRLRGHLPLDLDITIGAAGPGFVGTHRRELGKALLAAISAAAHEVGIDIEKQHVARGRSTHPLGADDLRTLGHIIRVAVAYLGSRVLEDKGFFGPDHLRPTNDVVKLIHRVTTRTNGFFKNTRDGSLDLLAKHHVSLQRIAQHLGAHRSFALVDDQDIAEIYAVVLTSLPPEVKLGDEFKDLQQHYTPVGIARQMLSRLPIERIPAEDRIVFDPAAGSGSLLLEATRRLGAMQDRPPEAEAFRSWLASHVLGNDADPRASMIADLRYTLVRETFGESVPYPAPKFLKRDYRLLTARDFSMLPGGRPRILVANPPYAEERHASRGHDVQTAAEFVLKVLEWLREGDLFALVLPEAFLAQRTHLVGEARDALTRSADIFECWQLREGIVGTSARQAVCVLLGAIGRARYSGTVARKIQTGAEIEEVRHTGFLGPAWIANLERGADWTDAVEPPLFGAASVGASVDALFTAFCGPTPRRGTKPVGDAPSDDRIPYFRLDWQSLDTVAIVPTSVDKVQRYRLKSDLSKPAKRHEADFSRPKLLFHNSTNRNTRRRPKVFFDEHGFWPDHNVHCLVVRSRPDPALVPVGWERVGDRERLYWLLGILTSKTGRSLVEARRSARHTAKRTYMGIPLPKKMDASIIENVRAWVNDPSGGAEYLAQIDGAVERSYGVPSVQMTRTGKDPQLRTWRSEQTKPSRAVRGHIASVTMDGRIQLYLTDLDEPEMQFETSLPQDLPGWALGGLWFDAELNNEVRTIRELEARPWALRGFQHPTQSELGSLVYGFLPVTEAPAQPPEDLASRFQSLRSKAAVMGLVPEEVEELRLVEAGLDKAEEESPRSREAHRRQIAREQEIQRLIGLVPHTTARNL